MFSVATDASTLLISPTETGIDLSASANGNEFGLLVSDKYASMYVADPKAEVDEGQPGRSVHCKIPTPGRCCAILAAHSAGPVWCTLVPLLSTATVTGMSFTSNS